MPTIDGVAVTSTQEEVYNVIATDGPMADVVLVPVVQHVGALHQSSSGIRTRRKELESKNLIVEVSTKRLPSGRKARVFAAKRRHRIVNL